MDKQSAFKFNDKGEDKENILSIKLTNEMLRMVFDGLYDAVFIQDLDGSVLDVNAKMLEMYGVDRATALQFNVQEGFSSLRNPSGELPRLWKKVIAGEEQFFEWIAQKPSDGSEFYVEVYLRRLTLEHGDAILATVRDISERKAVEEKLTFLSLYDGLTGLYNRGYFQQEMIRLEKSRIFPVGLIICDLDGLKLINDTLGHNMGDKILKSAALIIKDAFRGSDVVARIGGDEFAIVVPNGDEETLTTARDRIYKAVDKYNISNSDIPLSISVGFSLVEELPINTVQLFKDADSDMYNEKMQKDVSTRSNYIVYY